jgi:sterol desaturase/sphingolipid hydroxylase (fatty acid hydroxylase superfamily)
MPQLSWHLWVIVTLVFYAAVSFGLDLACKTLFASRCIEAERRTPAKVDGWKVVALFIVNTVQVATALSLSANLHARGVGGLYDVKMSSWARLPLVGAQSLLILMIFDANFFWVHRFTHRHKRVFARLHAEHHRPRFPNVWHLQYQNPLDYFLTTSAPMLWVTLLPIPLSTTSYLVAMVMASFLNIAGHCGYEVSNTIIGFPTLNGWAAYFDPRRRWIARLFNNVVHHDMHHQLFSCNYSLYFTYWDRLCGTCHPAGDAVDRYVTTPPRATT